MATVLSPRPRTHLASDLDYLQGTWTCIAGRRQARLLIAGRRYTFEFLDGDGEFYMGTFVIDPTTSPKIMDMLIDEGPERHRGQTSLCIYQLDGDVLHWCPSRPGSEDRHRRFPSVDDDRFLSLVFKHERRPRQT